MAVLIAAGAAAAAVLVALAFVMRRRSGRVAEDMPEEGLSEDQVAALQHKQRSSARSVRRR